MHTLREAFIIRRIWSGADPSEVDVSSPFENKKSRCEYKKPIAQVPWGLQDGFAC